MSNFRPGDIYSQTYNLRFKCGGITYSRLYLESFNGSFEPTSTDGHIEYDNTEVFGYSTSTKDYRWLNLKYQDIEILTAAENITGEYCHEELGGNTERINLTGLDLLKLLNKYAVKQTDMPVLPQPTIINFYIDSTQYSAEDGMTWQEWINSSYSNGWFLNENRVADSEGSSYSYISSISLSDVIIANHHYSESYHSGEGCCVVKGTKVTMADNSYKAIEEVVPGDLVLSYNMDNNKLYQTKVNKLILEPNSTNMAELVFENNSSLTITEYHPILTNTGWHSITKVHNYKELLPGDVVKTTDGWTKLISIRRYITEPFTTYNLDVLDFNETAQTDNDINDNYCANGIIIHNAGFCPGVE